jgi:hypothetical protein
VSQASEGRELSLDTQAIRQLTLTAALRRRCHRWVARTQVIQAERHADLQLELSSREDDSDPVGDGVDVALRFGPRRPL